MTRIGILLSGRGSNFIAISQAIARNDIPDAEIALVVSNKLSAPGLAAAEQLGIRTCVVGGKDLSAAHRDRMNLLALAEARVDLVCLAGYMRLISPEFVAAYPNRILNVHPSLLPSFPGLDAQAQALEAGVKIAGCTVHFVDEKIDHGIVILQRAVTVEDEDTAETLAARILVEEHLAYPEALRRVLSGDYEVQGRRYVLRKPPV